MVKEVLMSRLRGKARLLDAENTLWRVHGEMMDAIRSENPIYFMQALHTLERYFRDYQMYGYRGMDINTQEKYFSEHYERFKKEGLYGLR